MIENNLTVSRRDRDALAAAQGAVVTGLPALALAVGAVGALPLLAGTADALLAAFLPGLVVAPMLEGLVLLGVLGLSLPLAMLAQREVARVAADDLDRGRAAAAGVGMVTALVSGAAALTQVSGLAGLADAGTGIAGALLLTGVVGGAAFRALPALSRRDGVPALYSAASAAGLGAGALVVLAGWMDAAALAFPLLDWPRMALYMALPHPLGDMASVAVVVGSLAPVSYLVGWGLRRLMPDARPRDLGLGLALPLVSPVLSMAALALLFSLTNPGVAVAHAFMALGALLGALPNLAAVAWAMGTGSSRSDPVALEEYTG